MTIFDILENIVFLFFPILVYYLLLSLQDVSGEKKKLYIRLVIYTQMYLMLILNGDGLVRFPICFFSIPILLALNKKLYFTYIVTNLAVTICLLFIGFNPIGIVLNFIMFILVFELLKKHKSKYSIFVYIVLRGMFYIYLYGLNDIISIPTCILMAVILYVMIMLILRIDQYADNLINYKKVIGSLEKEKELQKSLFKVTHEIKNPLAVCKGYLEMLNNCNDLEKYTKFVPIIRDEVDHTLLIINDFSNLSKLNIEKDIIELKIFLDDVTDIVRNIYNQANIELKYNFKNDDVFIYGDYTRLKQVMFNIMKNSKESINKVKGVVSIRVKLDKEHGKVLIIVKDNGEGMTKEVLEKIKTPFFTTKQKGTGLGIYLSNEIIKLHDGSINYESSNKGTTCTIVLPLYKEKAVKK